MAATRPTARPGMGSVAGSVAAIAVGLAGPIGSLRGWGPVEMEPQVAARGQLILAGAVTASTGFSHLAGRIDRARLRAATRIAVLVAVTTATMGATADNVGRAPAVIALTGAALAAFAVRDWRCGAIDGAHAGGSERPSVAVGPLLPLVAAEVAWAAFDARPATVALLAAAAAITWGYTVRPVASSTIEARVRAAATAAVTAIGRVPADVIGRRRSTTEPRHAGRPGPAGETVAAVLASAAVAASWTPVLWRLSNGPPKSFVLGIDDYPRHLAAATRIEFLPFRAEVPHLLFHLLTRLTTAVLGSSVAPVAVLATATMASVLAVRHLMTLPEPSGRRIGPRAATVVAVGYFAAETPALVLHAVGAVDGTDPYLTVHWWGNPTWLMGLPFLVLILPLVDSLITSPSLPPALARRRVAAAAVVTVLGTLAKPSLMVCLVPVLPVHLLLRRVDRRTVRRVMGAVVVPAALIIVWQTWFLGAGRSSEFSAGFTFDPIVQPAFGWDRAGPVFWLPLLVVVAALVVTRGAFIRDPLVTLVLSCTAVALPLMLTVRETGVKAFDGNMAVPMQACTTLLVLLALRCTTNAALAAARSAGTWRTPRTVVLGTFALAFLAGGVVSYLDATQVVDVPTDWQSVEPSR